MVGLKQRSVGTGRGTARWLASSGAVAVAAAILVGAQSQPTRVATASEARPPASRDSADQRLWIDMKNVALRIDEKTTMGVRDLRGEVVASTPDHIAVLDDVNSFQIRVTSGTVALDGEAVTALLNNVVFNYKGSPIRKIRVTIANGEVVQRGVMHKGVDIPFEIHSKPQLEPDGRLRFHPSKMKIFGGVNGLALLHALGLHMEKMLNLKGSKGASVQGDDILLDPVSIIPPPQVVGKLASVAVEGNLLVQSFTRLPDDAIFGTRVRPDSGVRNFVFFRGGHLRFGKLTMTDTDLLIRDADERDPFDLYIKKYNEQLVAGATRNLPDYGLRTLMPDYAKLGRLELRPVVTEGGDVAKKLSAPRPPAAPDSIR